MKKILKLMPDYECFPLWISDNNGLDNVNPDVLNIPNELKRSLHSWSDLYDKTLNLEDPLSSGFPNQESEENFDLEGKKLWHELKKYLGNEYSVVYFSVKVNNLDPYCKVYIHTEMSKSELICHISNRIKGEVCVRSIVSNIIEVDVFSNEDFDLKKLDNEDGFIYYPFYLEIEPSNENTNISIYINEISLLLQSLSNDCKDAVSSCGFEDKLFKKNI